MQRRIAAALLAFAALPALAEDGFFRDVESSPHERVEDARLKATAMVCSMIVRYNNARPVAQEITYAGPQNQCMVGYEGALAAATPPAFAAKIAGPGGDPLTAGPPYDCAIVVLFDPAAPSGALASFIGASSCVSTRTSALAAAKQNVACIFEAHASCPQ